MDPSQPAGKLQSVNLTEISYMMETENVRMKDEVRTQWGQLLSRILENKPSTSVQGFDRAFTTLYGFRPKRDSCTGTESMKVEDLTAL